VIPQTIVGFWFFLLLVAPGLTYELMRERRRPAIAGTAFREASRIALASFVFSLIAFCLLMALRAVAPGSIFDLGAYLRDSGYLRQNYSRFIFTAILGVVLALGLAALSVGLPEWLGTRITPATAKKFRLPLWLCHRGLPGRLTSGGVLWRVLVRDQPDGKVPYVSLRLSDGTRVAGYLRHYSDDADIDKQEIALKPGTAGTFTVQERDKDHKLGHAEHRWLGLGVGPLQRGQLRQSRLQNGRSVAQLELSTPETSCTGTRSAVLDAADVTAIRDRSSLFIQTRHRAGPSCGISFVVLISDADLEALRRMRFRFTIRLQATSCNRG
jgi:hypothetical protein